MQGEWGHGKDGRCAEGCWGTFDQLQLAKAQVSCKCREAHTTVCPPSSPTVSQRVLTKPQRVVVLGAGFDSGLTSEQHPHTEHSAPCLLSIVRSHTNLPPCNGVL